MFRVPFYFLLVCAALLFALQFGYIGAGGGVELSGDPGPGQTVVADLGDFKGTYTVRGPANVTYALISGGTDATSFAHANLFGAEISAIRPLLERYPDLHRCDPRGARELLKIAADVNIVGSSSVVGKFHRAMKLNRERENSGGLRPCATMRGQWLDLVQVQRSDGEVVTADQYLQKVTNRLPHYFIHVESLQTRDCKDAF